MGDLIERLRGNSSPHYELMREAADEIERLGAPCECGWPKPGNCEMCGKPFVSEQKAAYRVSSENTP
jgi:hypothetical protein